MDSIEILKAVESFYNSAWNKLIIFTSVLLAIVGVVIPIILTWWQNRNLRLREETLKRELENAFNEKVNSLNEEITKKIEELVNKNFTDIEKKIEKKILKVKALSFHIQANNELSKNEFKDAAESLITAGHGYLKGEDYLNLGRVNSLLKLNFEKLTKEEFDELEFDCKEPSSYLKELESMNDNNLFTDLITNFNKAIRNAKKNKGKESKP